MGAEVCCATYQRRRTRLRASQVAGGRTPIRGVEDQIVRLEDAVQEGPGRRGGNLTAHLQVGQRQPPAVSWKPWHQKGSVKHLP